MKFIEHLTLKLRANKYKYKDDIGGVAFLINKIKQGQTVMDIGAHKAGYLYLMLRAVGSTGKVIGFEPQSVLYAYLQKIKALFNWQQVTVEHLALSDAETEATLLIPVNRKSKKSAPGATILDNRERNDIGLSEKVKTISLDHYCILHNIEPSFLKIDVEGNEFNVFRGGINTLKKYKPAILVECDAGYVGRDKVLETFDLLKSLGYKGSFISGADTFSLNEFSFDKHQNHNSPGYFCNNFLFE